MLSVCPVCGAEPPPNAVICPHDGQVLVAPQSDPLIGQTVGMYRIVSRLGTGGMGAVYEGFETNIEKKVAIKIVHPHLSNHPDLPTLLAEARAANAVGDRGIVDVHGFGALPDGRQYLVMELLSGEGLDTRLSREGKLPFAELVHLAESVLSSLVAAHAAGLIHRDIKPANIFIVQPPNGLPYTKLLDFGLASKSREEARVAMGTPGYAAPEQIQGKSMGPAADLYALGCVLFEMAVGHQPFVAPQLTDAIKLQLSGERPHVRAERPDVPEAFDALVFSMMQIDPAARPASAADVLQAVQAMAPKPRTALRWAIPLAALLVAGGVAAVVLRPPPVIAPQADPLERAVLKAAAEVGERADAGAWSEAISRLRAAESAYAGRREWAALRGGLSTSLELEAASALDEGDLARSRSLVDALSGLLPADAGTGVRRSLERAELAKRTGMVRVGDVFVDAYEYPNRAGVEPVTSVDWEEAVKLCQLIGKHLCSEDEWERACRGAEHREFPYGNELERGRCVGKTQQKTVAGGAPHCVSPEGVHDMSGNVAEWTATAFRENGPQKVIRGGSFAQSNVKLGCGARDYFLPGQGGAKHIGLRCCY